MQDTAIQIANERGHESQDRSAGFREPSSDLATAKSLPGTALATKDHMQQLMAAEANPDLPDTYERTVVPQAGISQQEKQRTVENFLHKAGGIDRETTLKDLRTLLNRSGEAREEILNNLHELVTQKFYDPALGKKRQEFVSSLVSEAARPSEVKRQGDYASCVIASGVHRLAKGDPAAYVKIATEMAIQGRSAFADGTPIIYNRNSINETADRGLAESVVQSSAMKSLNIGANGTFSRTAEQFYEALFDQAFVRKDHLPGSGQIVSQEFLQELKDSSGKNMVSLRWSSSGVHSLHALEIVGVVEDKNGEITAVLFRNPWGKVEGDLPVNAEVSNADEAVYQMSVKEFSDRLNYALVPGDEANRGVTAGWEKIDQRGATVFGLLLRLTEEKSKKSLGSQPEADWTKQDNSPQDDSKATRSQKDTTPNQIRGPNPGFNWSDEKFTVVAPGPQFIEKRGLDRDRDIGRGRIFL